jgi:hypothetical protein
LASSNKGRFFVRQLKRAPEMLAFFLIASPGVPKAEVSTHAGEYSR